MDQVVVVFLQQRVVQIGDGLIGTDPLFKSSQMAPQRVVAGVRPLLAGRLSFLAFKQVCDAVADGGGKVACRCPTVAAVALPRLARRDVVVSAVLSQVKS